MPVGSSSARAAELLGGLNPTQAELETAEQKARQPSGVLGHTLDFVSRGNYASAAFADALLQNGFTAIGQGLEDAFQELVAPTKRLDFTDLIQKHAPDFYETNPWTATVLGFAANVAFDPLTYITFGTGGVAKNIIVQGARRGLTNRGIRLFNKALTRYGSVERAESAVSKLVELGNEGLVFAKGSGIATVRVPLSGRFGTDPKFFAVGAKIPFLEGAINGTRATVEAALNTKPGQALAEIGTRVQDFTSAVKEAFFRDFGLPDEFVKMRDSLLGDLELAEGKARQSALALFRGISKERRELIGEAALEIDSRTRKALAQRGALQRAGQQAEDPIFGQIVDDVVREKGLNAREFAAYSTMRRSFQELANFEVEAGLLRATVANYAPRIYNVIKDSDFIQLAKARRAGGSARPTFLSSSQARSFNTLEEARQAGFVPELDAALLYANRVTAGGRALLNHKFNQAAKMVLDGIEDPKTIRLIEKEMRFVGEGSIPATWDGAVRYGLEAYDKMLNWFRRGATILRPGFATRQLFSNAMQSYLVLGTRALGAFDPRRFGEVYAFLNSLDDVKQLAKFNWRSNFGDVINGRQLADEVFRNDIAQGTVLGGVRFANNFDSLLVQIDKSAGQNRNWRQWLKNGPLSYWNWARKFEDAARTNLYLSARLLGHGERGARSMVNRALFDYAQGLSRFERQTIRRIIPFYSFQRFALPLLKDTVLQNPGRIANLSKASDAVFATLNKIASGDELNDTERRVIPGWLLEQPHTFLKMGMDNRAIFGAFNNFSPLDVLAFGEVTDPKTGELDVKRTVQKTILASLAPVLKVPLEIATNTNFFIGREAISDERTGLQEAGVVRADTEVWTKFMSLGEPLLEAVGFEFATNDKGERRAYINPYLAYVATNQFPVLKDIMKVNRDTNQRPIERALQLFTGISTYEFDLAQQQQWRLRELKEQARARLAREKRLVREGLRDPEEAQRDLQELMRTLGAEAELLTREPVRQAIQPQEGGILP